MYKGEVKHLREMVAWLNCELEKTKIPANFAETSLRQKLIELMKSGQYIPAIKEYRISTGASLKDAVEYCRAMRIEILRGLHGDFNMENVDSNGYIRREYMGLNI